MTSPIERWMREQEELGVKKVQTNLTFHLKPAQAAENFCRHCGGNEVWIHLGFHQEGPQGVTTERPFDGSKPVLMCTGCSTVVIVQRCGA